MNYILNIILLRSFLKQLNKATAREYGIAILFKHWKNKTYEILFILLRSFLKQFNEFMSVAVLNCALIDYDAIAHRYGVCS